MKLKTRLIIAFFVIICVPVILASIAFIGFGNYQMRAIEQHYGITGVTYESLSNSMQVVSKLTQKTFEELHEQVNTDVDKFQD